MPDRRTLTASSIPRTPAEPLRAPRDDRDVRPQLRPAFRHFAAPPWTALTRGYPTVCSPGARSAPTAQRTGARSRTGLSYHDKSQDMTTATKLRLRFAKRGDLRLVSHHDIMRCLERMAPRADSSGAKPGVHAAAENRLCPGTGAGDRGAKRDRRYRAVRAQRASRRAVPLSSSRSSGFPLARCRGSAAGRTGTPTRGSRL